MRRLYGPAAQPSQAIDGTVPVSETEWQAANKRNAWRFECLRALDRLEVLAGGHLPHEGRAWSACLQCRITTLRMDIENGVILVPNDVGK